MIAFRPLRKYAVFSGRSNRMEYWSYTFLVFALTILVHILDRVTGNFYQDYGVGVFGVTLSLILLVPGLAVAIRRLHDTNRSGWWYLLALIPILGWIWIFVLFCLKGSSGENRFGPDPLAPPKE